jgi:hypothetical protein
VPVRFAYTIGSSTLERVVSIIDLGVILDSKLSFRNHIDATIGKGLAMLVFIKRLSSEFRDPYTLKALYVSLVRSRLEYASCVWQPFYAVHIARIERIQEKFVKYAVRRLGWDISLDLPPYRVPTYSTRRHDFFQIDYHRTNYGAFEPAALHSFNEIADLLDFNLSRSRFVTQLRSDSRTS